MTEQQNESRKGNLRKSAALYARVSSERQKEEGTIGSQIEALVEYAQKEGYAVVPEWILADEGYSGATLIRPALERVRDLASEGVLEAVLIYSPDRLSRKYAYQVLLIEEWASQGVEVVFVQSPSARTPEEQLLVQFQGMIAEYERAQIAERTRRGKRHRAKAGVVNVLSGAPYGYRYTKRTDVSEAYYEVVEAEAEVVRQVFDRYTEEGWSIGAIARWLNERGIATRKGARWERSTIWGMLRNPAYEGKACFGKTERAERRKITRPLRQRGGFSPRVSASRERPRAEWIEIAVPALVSGSTFALAQEKLQSNKRYAARNTREPTLLQGMLVCSQCGYAYYRSSTRTQRRKLYYYRCLGSDDYRYPQGRVCQNRPVRQDYLDEVVWREIVRLLEDRDLVKAEIQRRLQSLQDSSPRRRRIEAIERELIRNGKGIAKLLDAYQEGLLELDELRQRVPRLRTRERALKAEQEALQAATQEKRVFLQLAEQMDQFLAHLREKAQTLTVTDRQKILHLVVKEIQVGPQTLRIKHCIPLGSSPPTGSSGPGHSQSYLLRSGSHFPSFGEHRSQPTGLGSRPGGFSLRPVRRRLCRLDPVRTAGARGLGTGPASAGNPSAQAESGENPDHNVRKRL